MDETDIPGGGGEGGWAAVKPAGCCICEYTCPTAGPWARTPGPRCPAVHRTPATTGGS